MAKDDERPQFNPKHRIAGAIILVSLAVIFVPMLLDESDTPAENQALTKIPERDAPQTKVVIAPVAPPAPAKLPSAESTAHKAEKPAESVNDQSKSVTTATIDRKADSSAKPRPAAAKSSDVDKVSKGWVVQVGTFANADNAERLREKLQAQGYSVNSESVTVEGSKAVRLRVGPYRDKAAAAKVQAQLQKDLSIRGVVLAYQ